MTFFILNSLSYCVSLLGFRGIRILSCILGTLGFDILRIRRKIILANIKLVYGTNLSIREQKKIGRKSMINFISTAIEFLGAKHLLKKAKFISENKQYADEIVGRNQGVYTICMHLGNWEYLCHINAKWFSPVNVVVKDVLKGRAELWIKNLRKKLGYKLIDRHSKFSATQQIFNAINNKEVIGFIVDQKRPKGQMLPFFGKDASTNDSLAKLYFRKPAPMVCTIITRQKPGVFLVKYFPEFIYHYNEDLSLSQNITKMTLKVNQFIEPIILQHPEEYYWLHNRWNLK